MSTTRKRAVRTAKKTINLVGKGPPSHKKIDKELEQMIIRSMCGMSEPVGVPARERFLAPGLKPVADEFLANRNYMNYLALFASNQLTAAFDEIANQLSDEEFVTIARAVWDRDDQPSANVGFWRSVLPRCARFPHWFMNDEERRCLTGLPNPCTIFRGVGPNETEPEGFAWTLEHSKAEFFAYQYKRGGRVPGHIFQAHVDPSCAIGYIDARGEVELLFLPTSIATWVVEEHRRAPL